MMGEGEPSDFKCYSQGGQRLELVRRERDIIWGRSILGRGTSVGKVGTGFGRPDRGRGTRAGFGEDFWGLSI